ncbi:hypothetical protein ACTU45_23990 [Streptomyces sp. 24-1644]|uniref:hypothetical protein n=1 Tax=Streptomyces sp. 24-1644 TaxID=3457315 RepID=UPI003FA6F86D
MSTSPPRDPSAPLPEPPQSPRSTQLIIIAVIMLIVAVALLIGLGTLYLTWQHPTLATPITAAGSTLALLITVVSVIVAMTKR